MAFGITSYPSEDRVEVHINPQAFARALQDHFSRYVLELMETENETLRSNFETWFEARQVPSR